ncbi:NB-ARC domain-containing protein, partial [uncultured Jatrophihabitans sp.]|uniref:NB-ARC domain-containing protein n=1 Tax=uncultured Jatrophihabitans sp. TaxID=1610747 RepID=UPI0035CC1ADE
MDPQRGTPSFESIGGPDPTFAATAEQMIVQQGDGNVQNIVMPARVARVVPRRVRFRVPRKTQSFTAREGALADLHAGWPAITVASAPAVQVLMGLPGVGKTQVAAAYLEAHSSEYDLVAWIRAVDPAADLAGLADELGLTDPEDTIEQRAQHMLTALAAWDSPWLIVLDNVESSAALTQWCPSCGSGRVLVTTRDRGLAGDFGRACPVEVFTLPESVDYLLRRSGRGPLPSSDPGADHGSDATEASALAVALGRLPLALAHAGAYCALSNGGPKFAEYQSRLQTLPAATLFASAPDAFYAKTVATTWAVSITAAGQRSRLAPDVLNMAALLDPDAIPLEFFDVLTNTHDDAVLATKALDDEVVDGGMAGRRHARDEAVAALVAYSLGDVENDHFAVHRLLQKVVQDDLVTTRDRRPAVNAAAALHAAEPGDQALPANWLQWQQTIRHLEVLTTQRDILLAESTPLAGLCNRAVGYLLYAGQTTTLSELAARTVKICALLLGPEHRDTLTARANLASSYHSAGRT